MKQLPKGVSSLEIQLANDLDIDGEQGRVSAVVAQLETPDSRNRVIHAGAVDTQDVLVSDWDHSALFNRAPVGTGRIWEDGDVLRAELQYDMERETGRDSFQLVKSIGALGHWSIGYEEVDMEVKNDQTHFWAVHMLEVSPTGWPASEGTYTVRTQSKRQRDADAHRWTLAQMNMKKAALHMAALTTFGDPK